MGGVEGLPESFSIIKRSLEPYISSRQEVSHIRQVLAAQLEAQVDQNTGDPKIACLSLPNDSTVLKSSHGNIRGLRKDYLRTLRANTKARQEYIDLVNGVQNGPKRISNNLVTSVPDTGGYIDSYLALVKERQRHERLRILQDYINRLSQKTTASAGYLEDMMGNISSLPRIPEDITASTEVGNQESSHRKLKGLVQNLEKSVLQAKIHSKGEKHVLDVLKSSQLKQHQGDSRENSRTPDFLEALGKTRNELIAWVESELSRAGDSDAQSNEQTDHSTRGSEGSVQQQIERNTSQYNQYLRSREIFLSAVANGTTPQLPVSPPKSTENNWGSESKETPVQLARILLSYLEELLLLSNEQKTTIQQRSHLTVCLSKQHKEAVQLFDRLADESHILPAFPIPSSQPARTGYVSSNPLTSDIPGAELASTAHRARAWTYAAESAATGTMETVLVSTEDGGMAVDGARNAISDLERLLGYPGGKKPLESHPDGSFVEVDDIWLTEETRTRTKNSQWGGSFSSGAASADAWAVLDGQLGVIR
jgi:hypothetical protein